MFLKNKNIIFKIRRSKVTDYAALRYVVEELSQNKWRYLQSKTTVLTIKRLSSGKHGIK